MNSFDELTKLTAVQAAPRLLGCELVREIDGETLRVRITETEAYDQTDAASHSYKGRTPRTDVMFGPAGHLYVYFTYGMHYCSNVVVGPEGRGTGVLMRAAEPLEGIHLMEQRRHKHGAELLNGPAKLCQALAINKTMNGHDLTKAPLRLVMNPPVQPESITATPRIGISRAVDKLWRFYIEA